MSLLDTRSLPRLVGERRGIVTDYQEVANQQGGYIKITFKLEDRDFQYILFPGRGATKGRQVNYFMSAVKQQLDLDNADLTLGEILELLKENEISIWFSRNAELNTMNVNFHESVVVTESTNLDEVTGA